MERCADARRRRERVEPIITHLTTTLPPAFDGEWTTADITRWSEEHLLLFLEGAGDALRVVTETTQRVIDDGCDRQSVAALADLGGAYEHLLFVLGAGLRVRVEPDVWDLYACAFESALAPFRDRATQIYEAGLAIAREHRVFGEASQRCARGLVRFGALPADLELVPHL